MNLVFVTSHPIQYQVPVFRCLEDFEGVELTVLFAMLPDAKSQGQGFGIEFEWDIPLLEGYSYKVLENVSSNPGVTHFSGCDTPGIYAELKKLKPDAVIVNGWVVKTCLQTLWACRRLRIPCLVRGEANDIQSRPAWKKVLQRLLVNQYQACLYIGGANKQFYVNRGVARHKLFPSLYCIDNERFQSQSKVIDKTVSELRQLWQIPQNAACFLYSGKFETKKHPLELLEALQMARASNSAIHLLMVGDGELKKQCEKFVEQHQLPVSFAGFLNQSVMVKAYLASDCLVLPSDSGETWGLVVNEAMSLGRPALVSNQAGCYLDLIEIGETGELFEFGNWEMLAEKLVSMSGNRDKLERMGQAAKSRIQRYSSDAAAAGIKHAAAAVCQQ